MSSRRVKYRLISLDSHSPLLNYLNSFTKRPSDTKQASRSNRPSDRGVTLQNMKRALIIDDEPEFLALISEILKSNGWEVFCAENGLEGLEVAQSASPDVVICDLMMPKANGFQFCRLVRQDELLNGLKILVTSGRDFQSDRNSAFEAGADAYLLKPFDESELFLALSRLGMSEEPAASDEIQVPDDPETPAVSQAPSNNSKFVRSYSEDAVSNKSSSASASVWFRFWGVRGSIPTPGSDTAFYGGNTSCVEFRSGKDLIILDSGSGIRPLGAKLRQEFGGDPIEITLLISHTHWDHIQGFPFFQPAYDPRNKIQVLGYEGSRQGLKATLTGQMESPYFPIGMTEMPGNISIRELSDLEFQIGSVRVKARFLNHPGVCVGYRLETDVSTVVYIPDNEMFTRRLSLAPGASNTKVHGGEKSLEYALDQESKLRSFIYGADALIMDAQYDAEEYAAHVGWGHGCLDDVVETALKAKVGKLFLFHHDPSHNDLKIQSMEEHARYLVRKQKSPMEVHAAREGVVTEFDESSQ